MATRGLLGVLPDFPSLRAPWRGLMAAAGSGVLFGAILLEGQFHAVDDARRDVYVRQWARLLLRSLNVEIVRAPGPAPRDTLVAQPRLVVANHRSTVDILLMLELFGGNILARADMASWPVLGTLARHGGTLFVDRDDPLSGAAAVQGMRERLRRGRTIGVFPEGTTFAGDEVHGFHAGAFIAIARERGCVHPYGVAYDDPGAVYGDEPATEHMRRLASFPRTRVAVAIGEPIAAAGLGVSALCDRAHDAVQELVHRARSLL